MNEFASWTKIITENVPVVMLLLSIGFGTIAFLSNKLFEQKKELDNNSIQVLVKDINALVARINELFTLHSTHERRIEGLETDVSTHLAKCTEREKMLVDIKREQTFHINKFNDALVPRSTEPSCSDRSDREN